MAIERTSTIGVPDGTPSDGGTASMVEAGIRLAQDVQLAILKIAAELREMRTAGQRDYDNVARRIKVLNRKIAGGMAMTDTNLVARAETAETGEMLRGVTFLEPRTRWNRVSGVVRGGLGREEPTSGIEINNISSVTDSSITGNLGPIWQGPKLCRGVDEFFMQVSVTPEENSTWPDGTSKILRYEFLVPVEKMTSLKVTVKGLPQAPVTAGVLRYPLGVNLL